MILAANKRYGLLTSGNPERLKALRHQLLFTQKIRLKTILVLAAYQPAGGKPPLAGCPVCGQGILQRMQPLEATFRSRSPPLAVSPHINLDPYAQSR